MAASGSGAPTAGRRSAGRSAELLRAGSGLGLERKLLINAACPRNSVPPRIVRLPRSGVLDKLQIFLPQMAKANEELRKHMETAGASQFDIENTEDCPGQVIEMPMEQEREVPANGARARAEGPSQWSKSESGRSQPMGQEREVPANGTRARAGGPSQWGRSGRSQPMGQEYLGLLFIFCTVPSSI
uniref:NOP protein chaperone 1 isoform X1 n=1 Tax=Pristiophorus japonicus TaxID=55135 RepID=UPI00398E97C8